MLVVLFASTALFVQIQPHPSWSCRTNTVDIRHEHAHEPCFPDQLFISQTVDVNIFLLFKKLSKESGSG
jgi:hypothetical protein